MTLGEFLKEQMTSREPWNCSTMPADWCLELGYPDFAFEWRSVTGEDACNDAHMQPGELLSLWDAGIGTALPEVSADDLMAGDIAVLEVVTTLVMVGVVASTSASEVGAIFSGGKWAIRGRRTIHFFGPEHVRVIKAWRP